MVSLPGMARQSMVKQDPSAEEDRREFQLQHPRQAKKSKAPWLELATFSTIEKFSGMVPYNGKISRTFFATIGYRWHLRIPEIQCERRVRFKSGSGRSGKNHLDMVVHKLVAKHGQTSSSSTPKGSTRTMVGFYCLLRE